MILWERHIKDEVDDRIRQCRNTADKVMKEPTGG